MANGKKTRQGSSTNSVQRSTFPLLSPMSQWGESGTLQPTPLIPQVRVGLAEAGRILAPPGRREEMEGGS
jgi:hypothetical protein